MYLANYKVNRDTSVIIIEVFFLVEIKCIDANYNFPP